MKVNVNIKRSDLIIFNIIMTPRLKSTYVAILGLAAIIFFWSGLKDGFPETGYQLFIMAFTSICAGIGGLIAGAIFSQIFILFSSSKTNGTLGNHEYEITDEGLYEKTSVNEGVSKWDGIHDIIITGPYILFKISSFLFHMIPKRSFTSEKEYIQFAQKAQDAWREKKGKLIKS